MKEVYEGNPSLGDPMSIMGQLNDSCQRIEKLRADLQRYQTMLEDADGDIGGGVASGGPSTPNASLARHHSSVLSPHHNGGASPRSSVTSHRTSLSDESLSRSASDSSVCTNPPSSNTTTTTTTSLHRVANSATTTTTTIGEGNKPTPSDPLPSQGSVLHSSSQQTNTHSLIISFSKPGEHLRFLITLILFLCCTEVHDNEEMWLLLVIDSVKRV
ncbi:Cdc42-interacting protein 4-like [Homarus americanus]|uniref:Cdc42-interacting protein 4-like n=1 Tax=Homarus americanus TaxID=6706 RepID=A0A8J5TIM8_HOMAM|nr:Cdc42-interacting protein 4-like [Homarus americanus]